MDAIVFDWDGTLIDTLPAIYEANRLVLAEHGLPFDPDLYRAAYVPDWRLMYHRLGVPDDKLEHVGLRWLELYRLAGEASLLPRSAESLRRLSEAGYVLGLVTAGDRDVVTEQIQRLGVDAYLTVRVFGNDEFSPKPHPDPLLHVLERLERRDRVATARYIGDVPDDMRMARAVGAIGVGIESVNWRPDDLRDAGASAIFPSVAAFVDDLLGQAAETPAAAGRA
ncbi:MAG TPA: HAD-IA family hydrolase [Candidatus Limnocylindrales bacterium]|nr:HAD-IA family hydrolase [Candidatus Limnocylindrales bacterium]